MTAMYKHVVLVLLATLLPAVSAVGWDVETDLDRYVQATDPNYSYEVVNTCNLTDDQAVVYVVNMTSQQWLDETFSDRPIWWHQMLVAVPYTLKNTEHGALMIGGGSNRNPESILACDDAGMSVLASASTDGGIVMGMIRNVPNQPIVMAGDPYQESRTEDNWISWTWNQLVYRNQDGSVPTEILARFPMTKAAKAGLDTIANVANDQAGLSITKFIVTGASKRGWTTWSLAATDRRVVAAVPIVFTLLHINETMQKHFRSLGGYSWA
eukprot:GHVU01197873.1.p1 GENE.GHVU01197873.1~~GHVU01197873.1.p1  ORF type:complete len:268 (-),score=38.72 GHVU01197873.1:576-1379(-)